VSLRSHSCSCQVAIAFVSLPGSLQADSEKSLEANLTTELLTSFTFSLTHWVFVTALRICILAVALESAASGADGSCLRSARPRLSNADDKDK
jgi:hypothetical protein